MCPRTFEMTREQGFMDFNIFKKIIDELIEVNPVYAQKNEVWCHHFGESLMHPEFDKFIKYAVDKKVNVQLSLNPLLLTRENAIKMINANPSLLYFSLDGHNDDSFLRIRGLKKGYDKSKENIINFLDLKEREKSETKIVLSMIDFKENEDSINKAKAYWGKIKGIDKILIKKFVYWDGNVEEINQLETNSAGISDKSLVTCHIPWNTMTVLWNGDIVPCCFDYNGRYVLGNAKDSTLSDIWNNDKMIKLRKEFIENNVLNPLCRNCKQLHTIA